MIVPRLERLEDGVAFDNLAPAFILLLMELPELLGPDQPDEVKRRLFPDPSDDEAVREDWERLVHPELFALLASAREIIAKDLAGLAPLELEGGFATWRLEIPAEHINGWIGGLNAARLTLGARHGIENEGDMRPDFGVDEDAAEGAELDPRNVAIVKIHLLGELQAMLIMDQHPPPDDGFGYEGYPDTDS